MVGMIPGQGMAGYLEVQQGHWVYEQQQEIPEVMQADLVTTMAQHDDAEAVP